MVGGGGESIVLKPSKIILSYMDISKTAISSVYEVPTMGQVFLWICAQEWDFRVMCIG